MAGRGRMVAPRAVSGCRTAREPARPACEIQPNGHLQQPKFRKWAFAGKPAMLSGLLQTCLPSPRRSASPQTHANPGLLILLMSAAAAGAEATLHPVDDLVLRAVRRELTDLPGSRFFASRDFTADPCSFAGVSCSWTAPPASSPSRLATRALARRTSRAPLPATSLPARGVLLLADLPLPMQASCTPWLP
jgi:hypothetical protein